MDDISLKRDAVKKVYNNQVLAVYFKFKRANKV